MLAPITPHFCEELWQRLGEKESIFKAAWPQYDPNMLVEDTVTYVIQVNGKLRAKIDTPTNISVDKLKGLVLSNEKITLWIKDKPVKNFIIIPQKLVNIVV